MQIKRQATDSENAKAVESSLSSQQSRLWILDQLEGSKSSHTRHLCLHLKGNLNVQALDESIATVIGRHDVLSYRFRVGENTGPRAVSEPVSSLLVADVSHFPADRGYKAALDMVKEEISRPFDLQTGPLFRAKLFKVNRESHVLLITAHEIVCDSASMLLLARELGAFYASDSRSPHTNPLAPYSDYVHREKEYLASSRFRSDLAFWKQRLANVTTGLELPTDLPRPPIQKFRGAERSRILEGALLDSIRTFCERERQSCFLILLTAFICLLHRYTAADEVILGSELASRDSSDTKSTVGPLSNPIVLRVDCSGDPTFHEMLQRVSQVWTGAKHHGDLPFPSLLENLHLPRDMSRSPLFQVMFSSREPFEDFRAGNIVFAPISISKQTEVLDLAAAVCERPSGIEISFSYNTDLFEGSTVARQLTHFVTLLQDALQDPARNLSELSVLTAAERHQILVEWNNTSVAYPRDIPLHKLIEDRVERLPETIALICESEKLTYRELNGRANQVAHRLRSLGVGPDVLVGVCAERSVEMVLALLGTMKAGGAYVPLDPEYPRERLHGMIEDAQPPVVLTQEHLLHAIPQNARRVLCLDRDWPTMASESTANPAITVGGKNLAYTIYTSGSTGKPKGVPNVHEGIVNRLLWMQETYRLNESDRVLQKTPYSFDVSVWEFFWPLMTGATLIMARPGGHKDVHYLTETIAKQKITTLHFVPSMLSIFLEADGVEHCRSIRRVFASGEALSYELQQRFFERLHAELHNLYGPTEAAVDVTFWACDRNSKRSIVPIGRPVANTQIYILDQRLQPVPVGVAGELHIGGRQLARGYLNRPDLTRQKFIPDPFSDSPDARLYKTGDLARFLPDGNIEYLGRIDHQVKLRGFRIELGEIEAALDEYPGVRQSIVVVREDVPGDKRLVAYVALTGASDLNHDAVRSELRKKLPEFMVPSSYVVLDVFPMTTSGKVDRKALPAPHAPYKSRPTIIAARNQTEALLVALFQEVLHLEAVSVTDDFFDLGGHSLLAARLLSEIQHQTGKRIPLTLLFRGSSPEYLARVIEDGLEVMPESTVTLIQEGDETWPFFAVVPPGENAVGYIKLARSLGEQQQFYKLQGSGPLLTGRPYTWDEMNQLASKYVDAMRSVQPEGPYFLGGMCDGAHLAIRMAKKIEDSGERVGMLAIFDTWVLENSQRRWAWMIDYYRQRIKELRKIPASEKIRLVSRRGADMLGKLLGRREPERPWAETYWPDKDYKPPGFSGRVTLFKRPKQPFYYKPDPEMGWGARARGGVDVQVLNVHHAEILHEPSVQVLAERLRACLLNTAAKPSARFEKAESAYSSPSGGGK